VIAADEFTLERVTETLKECKKVLDNVWTSMAIPPPHANGLSKKELREAMRQQRQELLPQEKATKKLCDQLQGLVGVLKDAQQIDQGDGDTVSNMHGTESAEQKEFRGNDRVQKALQDINHQVVSDETLVDPAADDLVRQLRHALELGEPVNDETEEKRGWNKSVFVDKKGKYEAPANTKRSGWREFKADPWYRAMKPNGRYG
jgi:hypothetical protein